MITEESTNFVAFNGSINTANEPDFLLRRVYQKCAHSCIKLS